MTYVITFCQNLLYLRVWASDIWRGIGQLTHCFASYLLTPIVHQYNGLQPMLFDLSLTNKNTLIDISEPAMWHEYWSEDVFVQQLSLQHLNMDLRYNKNALAELNDCTRGLNVVTFTTLLHLGPKSITSRTLLHLDPNVIPFKTLLLLGQLLHFGFQQATQTIEANFSHLTSTFHRYEQEIKVRSTRHNSSLICLRTWPKETFQKRCASWIHMMTNIVVDKSTWHAQPLSIGWLFSLDYIMVEISDVWFFKVYS